MILKGYREGLEQDGDDNATSGKVDDRPCTF